MRAVFFAAALVWLLAPPVPAEAGATAPKVRLILQITVDQLRADLPLRIRDRWTKDGFRRLYENGAVFTEAHHGHANTETIVGHATLATGADPSVHGMIGNTWLDRTTGAMHYNIEDPAYDVVGNDGAAVPVAGHAEAGRPCRSRSPLALLAPTLAEQVAASDGRAKVFAVSLKDRAAVPMAGRAGKAFWWSDATGEFISSSYYFPDHRLPAWAVAWNAKHGADHLDGQAWTLLLDPSTYVERAKDDMPWEVPPAGMSRVFPHRLDRSVLGKSYYAAVEASPFGDDLELDFVRRLMRAEGLGRDDVTDYLSVAFSANDYIGHRYGPDSLEIEDELLRLDRAIAKLLETADEYAGKGRTLVVLTADHGIAEPVDELRAEGKDAGHVVLSEIEKSDGILRLEKRFGRDFIRRQWPPYVYLDTDALKRRHVDPETAARALAFELAKAPGVAAAFTREQIESGQLPKTDVARAVARSFYSNRSGDIHVVPKPGWQISFEGETATQFATGHGTPWDYDTHVPLVFEGAGVPHVTVDRRVETVDVAPTLAALAGVPAPARATGHALIVPASR
ncbi:MAG TPA: alkaline phosphatase family protein [Candidatus Binatia bacterium]|jgi:predicted AlkP superfamily pyrophosphatase or phosphodiesterase